jgi:GNAT superfamily N-acetyltransferase
MIRAIEAGDRAAWAPLWTAYLAFYETQLPAAIFDMTWQRLSDPNEPVWGALAIGDDGPIGLVHFLYHRSAWTIEPACYLQDLFVAPQVRGGGHGKALIDYVAAAAAKQGSTRLYWMTHETNATARRLYDAVAQRSGFIQYRKSLPTRSAD